MTYPLEMKKIQLGEMCGKSAGEMSDIDDKKALFHLEKGFCIFYKKQLC